jgi:hypothetical protein
MLYSMQTHFDTPIGIDLCKELVSRGVQHFRISGLNRSINDCEAMLAESSEAGAKSLLITDSLETLGLIHNTNIEWQNEPDGDGRPLYDYGSFMEAYRICKANNNILHGPTISNLDRNSLAWLRGFMAHSVPEDVIITYHHYTPDLYFWQAHEGFISRQEEIDALRRITGNRKIACSESGYNDPDEARQFGNIKAELQFAKDNNLEFWTYYQLNDGVLNNQTDSHFGVRRIDYSWKPVIDLFSPVAVA